MKKIISFWKNSEPFIMIFLLLAVLFSLIAQAIPSTPKVSHLQFLYIVDIPLLIIIFIRLIYLLKRKTIPLLLDVPYTILLLLHLFTRF